MFASIRVGRPLLPRCLLALIVVSLCTGLALAQEPPASVPAPARFLPQEWWLSHPPSEDPRLERPVTLWGAGMSLAKAFEEVAQQTGVKVRFWPADSFWPRVCVSIFLNSKQPPTLRSLLAQLAWVTEGSFAYAEEGGERVYSFVGPAADAEIMQKLWDYAEAETQERQRRHDEAVAQMREKALVKLNELREALSLSHDEAIRRYKGQDDLMLLALLEPTYRAIAQFLLTLSPDDLELMQPSSGIIRAWHEFTPRQQVYLRQAGREAQRKAEAERQRGRTGEHWDDWEWIERQPLEVEMQSSDSGGWSLMVMYPFDAPRSDDAMRMGFHIGLLQLVSDPRLEHSMGPRASMELKRLLGEDISEEEAQRIYERHDEQESRKRMREQLDEGLTRLGTLSPHMTVRLGALKLPMDPAKSHALWQLQEAVAAASGLHVISDCFWQPERSITPFLELLYPQGAGELNALRVLQLSCASSWGRDHLRTESRDYAPEVVGWEWSDTGDFLRFRSTERDVWRAAFLPEDVKQALDGWLEPHLPKAGASEQTAVEVPLDLPACGWLAGRLTMPQRRWGGRITYGDQTERKYAYRNAFAEATLALFHGRTYLYRVLGSLNDNQWARLKGDGLTWGADISLAPTRQEVIFDASETEHQPGELVRLRDLERGMGRPRDSAASAWCLLEFTAADGTTVGYPIATGVTVQPKDTSRLIPAETTQAVK